MKTLCINCWSKTVILFCILTLISCQKKSEHKIALMFPYTTGSRMAIEEQAFKAKASELNCEAVFTDAQSDEALQRKQAKELIDQGVDVIVVMAVNAYTAAEIVREAHAANVKVIGYDRLIHNSDLDFYISHNNYDVGKFMAEYALKVRPQGNYLILGGDKGDRNAIFVKTGQLDALQSAIKSGYVKIGFDVYVEDWSTDNAYINMCEYLKLNANNAPDVILTSYDGLAYGARKALDEAGITKDIVITGQDAEPQALKNIMSGKQTMTIYKPLKELAEKAVETAIKLANGEKPDTTGSINNLRKDVPSYLIAPVVVDKNNMLETVVKDGIISAAELGL